MATGKMFYAQRTPHGASTASGADRLVRFKTRAERDAWVSQDLDSIDAVDRTTRDATTRENARRWYPEAFRAGAGVFPPARVGDDYWDDADEDGAQEWTGAPTGGVYAEI